MGLLTRSLRPGAAAVRPLWGAVLLLTPERVLRAAAGRPVPPAAVTAVRVLGLRHLLQAGVTGARPAARLGALVDTAHAASCAALAARSPGWRRAALLDLAVETGFAASGWGTVRRRPGRPG